jgi:hypothetical protein
MPRERSLQLALALRGRASDNTEKPESSSYEAHINADNPMGTVQSIERVLRGLDALAGKETLELQRLEKTLADYQTQTGRPFEHEARLKDLLSRQAKLNTVLDLDKGDAQAVEPEDEADSAISPEPYRRAPMTRQQLNVTPPQCSF